MHQIIFGLRLHFPNKGFPLASTHFHVEISSNIAYTVADVFRILRALIVRCFKTPFSPHPMEMAQRGTHVIITHATSLYKKTKSKHAFPCEIKF